MKVFVLGRVPWAVALSGTDAIRLGKQPFHVVLSHCPGRRVSSAILPGYERYVAIESGSGDGGQEAQEPFPHVLYMMRAYFSRE